MLLPHRLVIRSSCCLALILALLHLAALGSLLPLDIPVWLKWALAASVAASFAASIRRHALHLAASSVRELVLKADGSIEGLRYDGVRFDAGVSAQTTVLPLLIVILLEIPGVRRLHPLVILPDALTAEDWRTLRAWLCWKVS